MWTIAWDVDDVLNDLTRGWLEQARGLGAGGRSLVFDELTENPPHRLLGIDRQAFLVSLDAFRASEACLGLAPCPILLDWFRDQGDRHHHLALTAVPLGFCHRAAMWTLQHYGRWIRTFAFVPSPRAGVDVPAYDASKTDYLLRTGGHVLVDDNEQAIDRAGAAGLDAFLWPRPWNRNRGLDPARVLAALGDRCTATPPRRR